MGLPQLRDVTRFLCPATLPAAHPELQEQAARVVEGAADRKAAARALLDWVYKNVDKEPSVGVPNGLEVLRRGLTRRLPDDGLRRAAGVAGVRVGQAPVDLSAA